MLYRDDDFDEEQTPRRRSKKDVILDDIDDVGTPNSVPAAGCSIPDSQCFIHVLMCIVYCI